MLLFHRLGWEDKDTVRRYVGESPLSYFQFSNMYMWRRVMNYRICEEDGILYVTERYRDHPTGAFLPFGAEGREEMAIARLRESLDGPLRLRPLSEEQARRVASLFPEGRMIEKRGQWDYLYRASDLSTLPGRHYHGKRNHISAFYAAHPTCVYHGIGEHATAQEMDLLRRALDRLSPREGQDLSEEYEANLDLIDHFTELSLRGGVLSIDGTPVACTVGEQITSSMALIHIEKADRDCRGAYPAINQAFVQNTFSHLALINREEDMGIEGLRRAKESYRPVDFNRVYAVELPPLR